MRIDIGCGRRKKEGFFGIDCQELDGVDLVCDCNETIPLDIREKWSCSLPIHTTRSVIR